MQDFFANFSEDLALKSTYLAWAIVAGVAALLLIFSLGLGWLDSARTFKYVATSIALVYTLVSLYWWCSLYANGNKDREGFQEWNIPTMKKVFENESADFQLMVPQSKAMTMDTFEWQIQDREGGEWVPCSTIKVREVFPGATTTVTGTPGTMLRLDRLERELDGCGVRCVIVSKSRIVYYTNECRISVVARYIKITDFSPPNALVILANEVSQDKSVDLKVGAKVEGDIATTLEYQWLKNGQGIEGGTKSLLRVNVNALLHYGDGYTCRIRGVDAGGRIFSAITAPYPGYVIGIKNETSAIMAITDDVYNVQTTASFTFVLTGILIEPAQAQAYTVYINGSVVGQLYQGATIDVLTEQTNPTDSGTSNQQRGHSWTVTIASETALSDFFNNATVSLSIQETSTSHIYFTPAHIYLKRTYVESTWVDPGVEDDSHVVHDIPGAETPLVLCGTDLRKLQLGQDEQNSSVSEKAGVAPGLYAAYGGGMVMAVTRPDERRVEVYDLSNVDVNGKTKPIASIQLGLFHKLDFSQNSTIIKMNRNHDLVFAFMLNDDIHIRVMVCSTKKIEKATTATTAATVARTWTQRGPDILVKIPTGASMEGYQLYIDEAARNVILGGLQHLQHLHVAMLFTYSQEENKFSTTERDWISHSSKFGLSASGDFSWLVISDDRSFVLYEKVGTRFTRKKAQGVSGIRAKLDYHGKRVLLHPFSIETAGSYIYSIKNRLGVVVEFNLISKDIENFKLDRMTSCNGDFSVISTQNKYYRIPNANSNSDSI